MPIAPLILGAAGILSNVFGASKAAKAAKEAAQIQVDSTKRGQLSADQANADQRSLMDPYVRMGLMSLADMQAKRFGGTRDQYLPTQPPPTSGPALSGDARTVADAYQRNLGRAPSLAEIQGHVGNPKFNPLTFMQDVAGTPEGRAFAANGGAQPATGAPVAFPAPAPPQGMSLAAIQAQRSPQGGMVTLLAPDGSTKQFPAQDAERVMQQARAAGHNLTRVN